MDLFADVKSLVLEGIGGMVADGVLPEGLSLDAVTVEPPRDAAHGDMATNAAMVLAKPARKNPREIAEALSARLDGAPGILGAEVAGPGFLNLRLDPARWFGLIPHVIGEGVNAGRSRMGAGRKVNVEFVCARHHHLGAAGLEQASHLQRHIHHHVGLAQPTAAASIAVAAPSRL